MYFNEKYLSYSERHQTENPKRKVMMKSVLLLTGLTILSHIAFAQNYQIQKSTISAGGGTAASANYKIATSIGDPGTNVSSSANYKIKIGLYPIGFNQAPTDIALDKLTIDENEPIGTQVGILSTTDPEINDTHTYSLVVGTGDTDNALFSISEDTLKSLDVFDFENKNSYSVLIQTDDGDGGTFPKIFTITINNVNDTSTNFTLSTSAEVMENLEAGETLATFTATIDQDIASFGDTHIYSLPAGVLDNDFFQISGTTLLTNSSFNYETQPSYTVTARTTDIGGAFFEKDITVTILDANDPPTDITLANVTYPALVFPENLPAGALIATLSSTDEDAVDTHAYSLVSSIDEDDVDNGFFQIIGDEIQIQNNMDFERAEGITFSFRIQTQDAAGEPFSKSFTVEVSETDEAPTAVKITGASPPLNISEDLEVGSPIAFLEAVDEDVADVYDPENLRHSYELTAGVIDNQSFEITGNLLKTLAPLNFSIKNSYTIVVRVKDLDDLSLQYDQSLQINIVESGVITNSNPIDLSLSNATASDNAIPGYLVGTLTTTDPDDAGGTDTYTYALVTGTGDTDNASFTINNDQLIVNTTFDASLKNEYLVRLKTTDPSNGAFTKAFTINIIEFINTPPSDISLSNASVDETATTGTFIGTFTTTDMDTPEAFTYNLVAGTGDTDNSSFSIVADELQTNGSFDFLVKESHSIRIMVTDNYGGTFEKAFAISVLDTRPPLHSSFTPASGGVNFDKTGNFIINFNETVNTGTANIIIKESLTDNLIETITASSGLVTGTGTQTITIDPVNALNGAVEHYITVESAAFSDLAGNPFAGWSDHSTWTFTTENTPPSDIDISSLSLDEAATIGTNVGTLSATDLDPDQSFTYTLVAGINDTDNTSFGIVGDQLQTKTTFDFLVKSNYSIRIQVADNYDSTFEKAFAITLFDTRPPVPSSFSPVSGAVDFDKTGNLSITFKEVVNTGSANIMIYESSTDILIETIGASSASVTGTGTQTITIDPVNDLTGGKQYYIVVSSGTFTDLADNEFAGLADEGTWSFTTYDDVSPVITLTATPPTHLDQGASVDVTVSIMDHSTVNVDFYAGGILTSPSSLSSTALSLAGGTYTATITDASFDAVGLQYFFTATDANGNPSSSKTLFMYLRKKQAELISGLKHGGTVEDYQIIAIPYLLNDNKILSIFNNFGTYDKSKWRIVRYNNSNGQYDDFPDFTTIDIGKGYWFNAVDETEIQLSERELPVVNYKDGYSMTLESGWNQIGNPFTVDLDWNKVISDNNIKDEIEALWVYTDGPSLNTSSTLKAFRGGFVKAKQITTLKLFPGELTNGRIAHDDMLSNSLEEEAWIFPITIKKDHYQYNSGYIGMHPDAKEGIDQYDLSSAPRFIKHLDYHFAPTSTSEMQTGQVVKLSDSYSWDLTVNTNLEPGLASINWPTEKIGDNSLVLFNTETQQLIDMKSNNSHEFYLTEHSKFRVYFNIPMEDIAPERTLLGNPYPNPSNGITRFPVILAGSQVQDVEINVYNLVGTEVSKVFQGTLENGFHEMVWNANDNLGNKVRAGIYIIQVTIKGKDQFMTFSRKVIIN